MNQIGIIGHGKLFKNIINQLDLASKIEDEVVNLCYTYKLDYFNTKKELFKLVREKSFDMEMAIKYYKNQLKKEMEAVK